MNELCAGNDKSSSKKNKHLLHLLLDFEWNETRSLIRCIYRHLFNTKRYKFESDFGPDKQLRCRHDIQYFVASAYDGDVLEIWSLVELVGSMKKKKVKRRRRRNWCPNYMRNRATSGKANAQLHKSGETYVLRLKDTKRKEKYRRPSFISVLYKVFACSHARI